MGYPTHDKIFRVVEGDMSKKAYKNKLNFLKKRAKGCYIQEKFFT